MSELSSREFWFIQVYSRYRGFNLAPFITDVTSFMSIKMSCHDSDSIIASLIKKKVISLSPDAHKVKFTDYGLELYASMVKSQKDWDGQEIIKVSNIEHDEILIYAGELFKANRIIREMFSEAAKELCVLDPYVGASMFDMLEDLETRAKVRIISSDRCTKAALNAYKGQYSNVEMRITPYGDVKFHDRFVIWDNSRGYHLGHSIKDLGKKDTQLNLIKEPRKQMALLEKRWDEATSV